MPTNDRDWTGVISGLRPQSTDDMPIIGPLEGVPNVLVNAGHGGHGLSISFFCAKAIQDIIEGAPKDKLGEDLWNLVDSKRCLI